MTQDNEMISVAADLETSCPSCDGTGGDTTGSREDRWRCRRCGGSGHIPTDLGRRILSLVRHNFRSMLEDTGDDWCGPGVP